ncbi:MAG TPA: helix-turn-helix transcriptional regulator [Kiritimatiellia bacterium]|jgi:transcriptional regulator with XRE-family HTH domain|nr:MAG: anaerobic benzoate catabolism transcriptional regulator [Verrucomicrobia bacterium ADurb.Bin018]HOE37550.1 helix-turn-helix transcriptional regulator [Kiritimatiellia bacterium]HOR73615.1 helix-turn-helix transcriptional regulator [Kiritimatiellia bacterium]HOU58086.1 helix-turn-helix transcriptional regulator [Kiritimatiellia bacterium]HPK69870.1 helix-turn-helix transcriptional regulator [Kiritimatiellia bacterium]
MSTNANVIVGEAIRRIREAVGLSQEKLAEKAAITYQYLSGIESGKKNFTVGVLQAIATALGLGVDALVAAAFADNQPVPVVDQRYFIKNSALPPRLTPDHIQSALNHTHKIVRLVNAALIKSSGRPLSSYIQGNNFSGIVSNILTDSFSTLTPYKHFHGQKYPDLVCDDKGKRIGGLEVKSTIQIGKGGESHNGHSGWHIVACFRIDKDTGDIQFIHVMFANLIGHGQRNADWKYIGSKVNKKTGSQRTETYNTTSTGTAKLRHGTVYLDPAAVKIDRWRTDPKVPVPPCSPFQLKTKTNKKKRRTGRD